MTVLLVLVMLTTCAAGVEDMSGRMFIFPEQSKTSRVKLNTAVQELRVLTLCHRSFTDLTRDHALFSLSTSSNSNDLLVIWLESAKTFAVYVRDKKAKYQGLDYKLNMWHSICTTWDSASGLVQLWFDGTPLTKKSSGSGSNIRGAMMITLGQEQDSHGGGFDINQSFVGMKSDVHLWDYKLSSCEIQKYVEEYQFTPGNVINWNALDFQIVDKVLIEPKAMTCQ